MNGRSLDLNDKGRLMLQIDEESSLTGLDVLFLVLLCDQHDPWLVLNT